MTIIMLLRAYFWARSGAAAQTSDRRRSRDLGARRRLLPGRLRRCNVDRCELMWGESIAMSHQYACPSTQQAADGCKHCLWTDRLYQMRIDSRRRCRSAVPHPEIATMETAAALVPSRTSRATSAPPMSGRIRHLCPCPLLRIERRRDNECSRRFAASHNDAPLPSRASHSRNRRRAGLTKHGGTPGSTSISCSAA